MEALLGLMESRLAPRLKEDAVRAGFMDCLRTMLPEVMHHLRDQSTAVREAARECLHVAATTAVNQDMQTDIVTLLSAGLAGRRAEPAALRALAAPAARASGQAHPDRAPPHQRAEPSGLPVRAQVHQGRRV